MIIKTWHGIFFFFLNISRFLKQWSLQSWSSAAGSHATKIKLLAGQLRELGATPVYRVRPSPERYLNKFGMHTIFTQIDGGRQMFIELERTRIARSYCRNTTHTLHGVSRLSTVVSILICWICFILNAFCTRELHLYV